MSFLMQDVLSRRSSGSPKPGEPEQYDGHARDTASLTRYPGDPAGSTRKQSSITRSFSDTWTLEFLCWLLALVSLVTILIVLCEFNGQPLASWRSGVTLNTVINVVSQIAQTAVFVPVAASISQLKWISYSKARPVGDMEDFDKASRGPMDSLWLMAKHPKWILVYLGALNTTLILLLGPFAQQSVSLPPRPTNLTSSSGSAPITLQYSASSVMQSISEYNNPTLEFNTVPPLMAAAVTNGLLTKDIINPSAVLASCETSNCTFPVYTSLAACSAAEDVTPLIRKHCPPGYPDTREGCSYTLPPLQEAPTTRRDNFTTTTLGLPSLWIGASEKQGLKASSSRTPVQYGASPANLVEFYVLFFPDMSLFSHDSKADVTASLVALRITLSLCLKTYNTTVANGVTLTTVTNTQQAPKFSEKPMMENQTVVSTIISTTDTHGTEYWMESATALALNSFLATGTFYGTYSGPQPDHPDSRNVASSDAARAFGDIFYNNPPHDHLDAIRPLLTNLETSVSNAMRITSDNKATASGTASRDEIYVDVEFRWLIVPILSIVLSLVFLVFVMVETRMKDVPAWKDGLNHTLFALEPETRIKMERLMGDGKGPESVPVVFEREGGRGWWLRGPG